MAKLTTKAEEEKPKILIRISHELRGKLILLRDLVNKQDNTEIDTEELCIDLLDDVVDVWIEQRSKHPEEFVTG